MHNNENDPNDPEDAARDQQREQWKQRQQRIAWFQGYCARSEQGFSLSPKTRVRYCCPCCDYPTLVERGGYEICHLCFWQDDGQDDPHADEVWGGPNHGYSLTRARENFARYLVMYEPEHDRRVGGSDSEEERAAKRELIRAFEELIAAMEAQQQVTAMDGDGDGNSREHWRIVAEKSKVLNKEFKRRFAKPRR